MAVRCPMCDVWKDKVCPNCGAAPTLSWRIMPVYGWQCIEGKLAIGLGITCNQKGILCFIGPWSVGLVVVWEES